MAPLVDFPPEPARPLAIATLFIRGENSDYIDDQGITVINQMFSNVQIATIKGAGHWLHAEQPQKFVELVSNFLT